MANVLLGVTGSVAAIRTPELFRALREAGYAVKVVVTGPARYFFDRRQLPEGTVFTDEDEWPRLAKKEFWQRDDPVLHIELRRWAEVFLIAPLDANTLAKLAYGLSDNCLTCVWRAWDTARPIILAPAMNTLMWEHPQTRQHLRLLAQLMHADVPDAAPGTLIEWMNAHCSPRVTIVGPIEKVLACGDSGLGAMAEVPELVSMVERTLAKSGA
jgi:phosphopantothenoylcysteine decarboxylase